MCGGHTSRCSRHDTNNVSSQPSRPSALHTNKSLKILENKSRYIFYSVHGQQLLSIALSAAEPLTVNHDCNATLSKREP